MRFVIRLANDGDADRVIRLIDEAAERLRAKGTDQWREPWPNREERDARVVEGIAARRTWLVTDGPALAATVTVHELDTADLWADVPGALEPACYISRLVRAPAYEGLGKAMLDWVAGEAAESALWMRVDVWTTNTALHEYYRRQGFEDVGEVSQERLQKINQAGRPSAKLFQRRVRPAYLPVPSPRVNGYGRAVELVAERAELA